MRLLGIALIERTIRSAFEAGIDDFYVVSGTRRASFTMMFKLAQSAQKKWRGLNGSGKIVPLMEGKKFINGELQDAA